jgi:hypothetical protein
MTARKACLLLIFIVCIAAISGCAADKKNTADSLSDDKYVAVQENYLTRCTLINGSYNLPPHITPPDPFIYDGSLNGSNIVGSGQAGWSNLRPENLNNYYPEVNDSFKALYGTLYYRDLAPSDTSTGLRVRGVYSLPYTFQSGFVLQDIDRNGTVYGSYDNVSIVLHEGEQWTSPTFNEVKSGGGTGMDQKPFSYVASFNTTWTITNIGMFEKSNLTRYENNASAIGHNMVYLHADPAER